MLMIVPKLTSPLFDWPHSGGQAAAPAGENQVGPFWLGHERSDLHHGRDQENHREGGWKAQQPRWSFVSHRWTSICAVGHKTSPDWHSYQSVRGPTVLGKTVIQWLDCYRTERTPLSVKLS